MKKSLFAMFALLLAFSMLLSACNPETVTVIQTQVVTVKETVQVVSETAPITMWASYDLTDESNPPSVTLNQIITNFEATTGITVNYEQVAWDQIAPKLALQAQSGGEMPDIVETSSQHISSLVSAGALMDISDLVADSPWVDQLNASEAQSCLLDGARYCVAADVRGGAWYYNLADFPNGWPTTTDGWLTEGARLKAEGKYIASFYAGQEYGAVELTWAPLIYSNGGSIFDAEGKPNWASDQTVEVVTWMRELLAQGYIPETNFTGDFSAGEKPWEDGTAGAVRGGSWSFLFIPGLSGKIEAGTTALGAAPAMNGGKNYVFLVGEGWGVPEGAANPDGAKAFLNFFMTPQNLTVWASQHYGIPTIDDAFKASAFDSTFYRATFDNLAENGIFMQSSPYYNESLTALAVAFQDLMLNPDMDIMTRLQAAQDEVLNQYWN